MSETRSDSLREYKEECTACSLKAVYVSTEVIVHDGPGIKKAIIYRCPKHKNVSAEEMLRLSVEKHKSEEYGR